MSEHEAEPTNSRKKPRLASGDVPTADYLTSILPENATDGIVSYGTSVDMCRLALVCKSLGESTERTAAAAVQVERDRIYWGLLLYGPRYDDHILEYGFKPALKRLYQLEMSTRESYHFDRLESAAWFLRRGQGRNTPADLHSPTGSVMMHDGMGGLVQAMGGLTKDKLKFLQTKRALPVGKHRFLVKVVYRHGVGGRDDVFVGIVNERYEPPYRSRDPSKHTKSVKNGAFVRLPRIDEEDGDTILFGATVDRETQSLELVFAESNATQVVKFSTIPGSEYRLAFRQERSNPNERFYGVLDIAVRDYFEAGEWERLFSRKKE